MEIFDCCLININKPCGPTSHQVSAWISKIFNRKAGHSGTLDPKVIGVLPIGIGKGTVFLHLLLKFPKEYVGIMKLHKSVEKSKLEKIFEEFTGEIYQVPPVRSAVKRTLKIKKIYNFEILEIDNKEILFKIKCSAGTYIRKLIHDIGLALGVGAHMTELIRTEVGPFKFKDSVILQKVLDYYNLWKETGDEKIKEILKPPEILLDYVPYVVVKEDALYSVSHGTYLGEKGILEVHGEIKENEYVLLTTPERKVFGIGLIKDKNLKGKRAIKPDRIIKVFNK
jgi:H/ACA ribonucleoprotein complex subunit 4